MATRWPEGGLGVASEAARDAIPPVTPKIAKNHGYIHNILTLSSLCNAHRFFALFGVMALLAPAA